VNSLINLGSSGVEGAPAAWREVIARLLLVKSVREELADVERKGVLR
jgi:hypothetical protein